METRREFLQMTLAAAALPAAAGAIAAASRASSLVSAPASVPPAPSATRPDGPSLDLYKVIYDERFPTSRTFAQQVSRHGVAVHAIKGDITSVWFNDLSVRWKQSPAAIAGLTAPAALFCLERLAWDHGMRCVFHEEHVIDQAELGWVYPIARRLTSFPLEQAIARPATQVGLPRLSHNTPHMELSTLVSWVIAWPFRRA